MRCWPNDGTKRMMLWVAMMLLLVGEKDPTEVEVET